MFGWRLYLEIDYCDPGWWTAEFVPLSWGAIKRVWREFKAAWKGEGAFCDALIRIAKEQPKPYSVLLLSRR